jgi:hypothetical protein
MLAHTLGLSGLAYLDGGTGSMIIQAALAGVLTGGYVVRTQWGRIREVVRAFVGKRAS